MTAFSPNPNKQQIGPVIIYGAGTTTHFTLDKSSKPVLSSLMAIKWKATEDVRVRFNLENHPSTGSINDSTPYFLEHEGIITLNPFIKSVHFSSVGSSPVKIFFQFS